LLSWARLPRSRDPEIIALAGTSFEAAARANSIPQRTRKRRHTPLVPPKLLCRTRVAEGEIGNSVPLTPGRTSPAKWRKRPSTRWLRARAHSRPAYPQPSVLSATELTSEWAKTGKMPAQPGLTPPRRQSCERRLKMLPGYPAEPSNSVTFFRTSVRLKRSAPQASAFAWSQNDGEVAFAPFPLAKAGATSFHHRLSQNYVQSSAIALYHC